MSKFYEIILPVRKSSSFMKYVIASKVMYMKALAVVRAPAANAADHGACVVVDIHHELSELSYALGWRGEL